MADAMDVFPGATGSLKKLYAPYRHHGLGRVCSWRRIGHTQMAQQRSALKPALSRAWGSSLDGFQQSNW
jgi:hypothetical protein